MAEILRILQLQLHQSVTTSQPPPQRPVHGEAPRSGEDEIASYVIRMTYELQLSEQKDPLYRPVKHPITKRSANVE